MEKLLCDRCGKGATVIWKGRPFCNADDPEHAGTGWHNYKPFGVVAIFNVNIAVEVVDLTNHAAMTDAVNNFLSDRGIGEGFIADWEYHPDTRKKVGEPERILVQLPEVPWEGDAFQEDRDECVG